MIWRMAAPFRWLNDSTSVIVGQVSKLQVKGSKIDLAPRKSKRASAMEALDV
jgi:hypothetical protein